MAPFQKRPVNASSLVAVVLLAIPKDLIWLKASLYVSLVRGRGRAGSKLIRTLQRERSDARPMRELWLRWEIRRRRLIISRGGPENIRNRLSIRAVVASHCQDAIRNALPYADTFCFVRAGICAKDRCSSASSVVSLLPSVRQDRTPIYIARLRPILGAALSHRRPVTQEVTIRDSGRPSSSTVLRQSQDGACNAE